MRSPCWQSRFPQVEVTHRVVLGHLLSNRPMGFQHGLSCGIRPSKCPRPTTGPIRCRAATPHSVGNKRAIFLSRPTGIPKPIPRCRRLLRTDAIPMFALAAHVIASRALVVPRMQASPVCQPHILSSRSPTSKAAPGRCPALKGLPRN